MDVHLKESCGRQAAHTHTHAHLTESCGEHAQTHTYRDISAPFSMTDVVGSAAALPALAFSLATVGELQAKMHPAGIRGLKLPLHEALRY